MAELLESVIESRLKRKLEAKGFKVLKLVCPGTVGVPDRLILRPGWSPGPPWAIEIKRPKKHERLVQQIIRDDWRKRGVLVLDMVNTQEQVDALVIKLFSICQVERVAMEWAGILAEKDTSL